MTIAIYMRTHPAHAWKFLCLADPALALIDKQLDVGGYSETLHVPIDLVVTDGRTVPEFLCSTQTQEEIDNAKTIRRSA